MPAGPHSQAPPTMAKSTQKADSPEAMTQHPGRQKVDVQLLQQDDQDEKDQRLDRIDKQQDDQPGQRPDVHAENRDQVGEGHQLR